MASSYTTNRNEHKLQLSMHLNLLCCCTCVAMKRSELKAGIREFDSDIRILRSVYETDRSRLASLDARYREIEGQMQTPCHRHEELCDTIEEALGIVTEDGSRWETSPRAPLLQNSPGGAERPTNARRYDRRRPRLADRYQNL